MLSIFSYACWPSAYLLLNHRYQLWEWRLWILSKMNDTSANLMNVLWFQPHVACQGTEWWGIQERNSDFIWKVSRPRYSELLPQRIVLSEVDGLFEEWEGWSNSVYWMWNNPSPWGRKFQEKRTIHIKHSCVNSHFHTYTHTHTDTHTLTQEEVLLVVAVFYLTSYWLCWVFVAVHRLSLVVGRGAALCCVQGLIAVASLVVEHLL